MRVQRWAEKMADWKELRRVYGLVDWKAEMKADWKESLPVESSVGYLVDHWVEN